MAVYKRSYRRYEGALTPLWSRFLVLPRYAFADMRQSRFLSLFLLGTMVVPIVYALIIYLHHNLSALDLLGLKADEIVPINSAFFLFFLGFQSMMAFFLTAFIGPGLISPDLANNALPLYLSRPFDRRDYVLGKMSVLMILLSAMTWIPGLLLFLLQAYLEGGSWMTENIQIAIAMFCGAWIWILVLSLLILALSAWVKWKPVAGGLLFVVFFVGAGFSQAINEILRTKWGHLINLSHLIGTVWVWSFGEDLRQGGGAVFFRIQYGEALPIWTTWCALVAFCGVCLYLLHRKIRGMEVVQ